jgi:lipoprotein signal peptidase
METLRHHRQNLSALLFLLGACTLLLRHLIASLFDNYALAFYMIDLIVIAVISLAVRFHVPKWCRLAIDFLVIFIGIDFIDRVAFSNSDFNLIDLLGLIVAVLAVWFKYKPPKQ